MSDKSDDDSDDLDPEDGGDFNEEEWDEEDWEKFFQEEEEQKRRLEQLLDKYGFSEEGLRRAFQELGYDLPDSDELQEPSADQEMEDQDIDAIIAAEQSDWDDEMTFRDDYQNAHPLFLTCHGLLLKVVKSMRHIWVDHRDHPVVTFQTGLFECMSKIIHAGYIDIDRALEAERGLVLAALKRARKSLLGSLFTIPKLEALKIFSNTFLSQLRHQIIELLQLINQEIISVKQKK
ncbi:MAG: nucleoporin NDC1 [candidate division KSB1 bacterium]|nr:nucleoporin NDC1 [candidate division KSB1 bacterium]